MAEEHSTCVCVKCATPFVRALSGNKGRLFTRCLDCRVSKGPRRVRQVWIVCRGCKEPFLVKKSHQHRGYCKYECHAKERKESARKRTCPECGSEFHARMSGSQRGAYIRTYCSRPCSNAARAKASKGQQAEIRQQKRAEALARKIERKKQATAHVVSRLFAIYAAKCATCGCKVEANQAKTKYICKRCSKEKHRRSASRRASKKLYKVRRRQRELEAFELIDPIAVFARDKWACQICGVRTPRKLRGTNEQSAPELDHIIPLARGGGHVWTNVQCACRKCNGLKSDKPLGQLLLDVAVQRPRGRGQEFISA